MRLLVALVVGAVVGAAAARFLRSPPALSPGASVAPSTPGAAAPVGSGRVAVDVSSAPAEEA